MTTETRRLGLGLKLGESPYVAEVNVRFGGVKSCLGGVKVVVGDGQEPCNAAVRLGRRRRLTARRRLASMTINCRRTRALLIRRTVAIAATVTNTGRASPRSC